jgi:hypothetical protein
MWKWIAAGTLAEDPDADLLDAMVMTKEKMIAA